MSPLEYSDGLANMQYPADSFITYCLTSYFLLLGTLPWYTYFKREIQWTFVCIETIIKWTYFSLKGIFKTSYGLYILWKELQQLQPHEQQHKQLKTDNSLVQILPPHEEFITEVREKLIQPPIYGTNNIFSGFTAGLSCIWYRIFIKLTYPQCIYRKNLFPTGCPQ